MKKWKTKRALSLTNTIWQARQYDLLTSISFFSWSMVACRLSTSALSEFCASLHACSITREISTKLKILKKLSSLEHRNLTAKSLLLHRYGIVGLNFPLNRLNNKIIIPRQCPWCYHHGRAIVRVHPVHLSGRRPQSKPNDSGCVSACIGCQSLHPPSPFIIITQPESWYSFYRPTEGRRLSRPSWLVTYRDGLPVHRWSSILVLTRSDVAQLRWSRPMCYH